jgi:hypothetical protein
VLILLVAACGGGGGGGGAIVRPAPPALDDASRWSSNVMIDVRASGPTGLGRIAARTPPPTWDSEVTRLAEETKDVLLSVLCNALTSVLNTGETPTHEEWQDWAVDEIGSRLIGYPYDLEAYIDGKADQVAAALQAVQVHPLLVRHYVQRCRVLGL